MNLWHDVAPHRVRPEDFLAVIEIEKGSKNKYEMDKETGALRLDRMGGRRRPAGCAGALLGVHPSAEPR